MMEVKTDWSKGIIWSIIVAKTGRRRLAARLMGPT